MKSTEETARKVLKCDECRAKYDNGCDGGICPELEDCIAVAEIQRKMVIDKACEWLLKNIDQDYIYNKGGYRNIKGWLNDLRKAMEEE